MDGGFVWLMLTLKAFRITKSLIEELASVVSSQRGSTSRNDEVDGSYWIHIQLSEPFLIYSIPYHIKKVCDSS